MNDIKVSVDVIRENGKWYIVLHCPKWMMSELYDAGLQKIGIASCSFKGNSSSMEPSTITLSLGKKNE